MELLWFLIIGGVAGWIAGEIMRGHGFGIAGNVVVGIIGALIGGYLFGYMNIGSYGLLGSLLTAVVGSVILLFFLNLFSRRSV